MLVLYFVHLVNMCIYIYNIYILTRKHELFIDYIDVVKSVGVDI